MDNRSKQITSDKNYSLKMAQRFPYDAPDKWWNSDGENPPVATDWAHLAARAVIINLQDRRGIKRGFEDIDEDVRREIVESLAEIIRLAHQYPLSDMEVNGETTIRTNREHSH